MSPGTVDAALVRRHLAALDAALSTLRRHAGRPVADLGADTEERWIVERGLMLCAQNCLDIATHVSASSGHDVPDYTSAIDELASLGVLSRDFVDWRDSATSWFTAIWPWIRTCCTSCSMNAWTISCSSLPAWRTTSVGPDRSGADRSR